MNHLPRRVSGLFIGLTIFPFALVAKPLGDTELPADDAYVASGSTSGTNYSGENRLIVRNFPIVPNFTRAAYLKFDLGELVGELESAEIRLPLTFGSVSSSATPLTIYLAADDLWSEETLTWNNQPLPNPTAADLLQSYTSAPAGSTVTLDVLSLIAQERLTNGFLTIKVFFGGSGNSPEVIFGSKESSPATRPTLVWTGTNIDPAPPSTPNGLTLSVLSDMEIDVSWAASTGAVDWYLVERRVEFGTWAPHQTIPGTLTSFVDGDLSPTTNYSYRITAVNGAGASGVSAESTANTGATTPPEAPTNLRASRASSQTAITLDWDDNSAIEDGYVVERRNDCGVFEVVGTTAASDTDFVDSGLAPGRSYTYRVFAQNGAGDSTVTDEVTYVLDVPNNLLGSFDFDFLRREGQGQEGCCLGYNAATDGPVRSGAYSIRFELEKNEERSEVTYFGSRPLNQEIWYGWSLFIPEEMDIGDGRRFDIVTQWHFIQGNDPCVTPPTPTLLTITGAGNWQFGILSTGVGPCDHVNNYYTIETALDDKGQWVDWVMHVKWTSDPNEGFMNVWKDDVLVFEYTGPTWREFLNQGPYWKAGVYKGAAGWPGQAPRVLYVDEMRMAGPGGSYEDVDPDTYEDAPTFATWQEWTFGEDADNPAIAGPGANIDGDLLLNIDEYGSGNNALVTDGDELRLLPCEGPFGETYGVLSVPRDGLKLDAVKEVQFSTNGIDWVPVPGDEMMVLQDTEFSYEVRVLLPFETTERIFWRIKYFEPVAAN